jgi:hypothetical protein
MSSKQAVLLGTALVAVLRSTANAAEVGSDSTVVVRGFVSQGFIKSTGNDYLVDSTRGSFAFSEAGINFTTQPSDRLRLGMQLFAFSLGPLGNYRVNADWYYLDYRLRDWFGIRAGRLKLPFGIYNDIADIDAARVPALLPSSLYTPSSRDFFLAQTGGEVYGFVPLRRLGALDYRLFGGSITVDLPSQAGSPVVISQLSIPYITGGRLNWETPLDGLRVGGGAIAGKFEVTYLFPMTPAINARINIYAAVGSVEYAARNLLLQGEYSQSRNETTSSDPALVPSRAVVSESTYVLGAYRVAPWLQPGVYYSMFHPDRNVRSGRENVQHDVSGTLRFDINANWIVKLEGHYMRGTARVSGTAASRAMAPENWALFLIKTTATF